MSTFRRLSLVLGGMGFLAGVTILPLLWAQGKDIAFIEQGPKSQFFSALKLPDDRQAQINMAGIVDAIQEAREGKGEWSVVIHSLQKLIEKPDDAFIEVQRLSPQGKPAKLQVSIKSEAQRLVGSLPPEGLQSYDLAYGGPAKALLAEAKTKGDPQALQEVASRYLHTEAGGEAISLLAGYAVERNEPFEAANLYRLVLERKSASKLTPQSLFKAAYAFFRTGDNAAGEEVWKVLGEKTRRDGGLRFGDQVVRLDRLRQEIDSGRQDNLVTARDTRVFRGGPSRTEQSMGGPPFLEKSAEQSILLQTDSGVKQWTEQYLSAATRYLSESRQQPIMPGFFPVASGGKVVYRTYDGVYAFTLKDGKLAWWHHTEGGLKVLLNESLKKGHIENWKAQFLQYGPHAILYDNTVLGTLSTDGARVYLVDDLAIPPHPQHMRSAQWGQVPNFGPLQDSVTRNSLKSINLDTGKLVWELSGRSDTASPLAGSFFLGAPLPLGGKLYVLNELKSELRLVCLEPRDDKDSSRPPEVIWIQRLATVNDSLQFDLNRRVQASSLAYGEGVMVCPTNAGAVVAIDLRSHSLLWAHSYREAPTESANPNPQPVPGRRGEIPMPNLNQTWKMAAPAITEGRVVFTAPDADAIVCLNLRDGQLVWRQKRETDDLYFAGVFAGKAVVVGKNYVRSVALDGKAGWRIEGTGVPSGQGVASDNVYYLPAKVGVDKEPEVCAIDLERGQIVAHTKSRNREEPGNLIFHEGQVVSQTIDRIVAYPQLQVKLALIDEELKKDPKNPIGLIERGELRLDKGELAGAYDDLHVALENNPPVELMPKARQKLYDTLTELLKRDFDRYEKHIDEYRTLCRADVAEEDVRRQGTYLCLVGKGREKQGRLLEAFDHYMKFGALTGNQELISVADEPNTRSRPDVWARGRITAMMAKASPQQRRPLEDRITEQWNSLKDQSDIDSVRGFVAVFGAAFEAGKYARLRLAERLIAEARDPKADELREAQLHLLQLCALQSTDPEIAGRAVDALARLMERKELWDHAAHYYRELGRNFPKVVVRKGETGADIYNRFLTDKRFLPYLEESRQAWSGRFKPGQRQHVNSPVVPTCTLEPTGELLPYFLRNRLTVEPGNAQLRVVDQSSGEEKWRNSGMPGLQYLTNQQNVRCSYHVQGHVVVVHLGHMVYGFDPVDQKKLWEYNLFAPGTTQAPQLAQVMRDREGDLQLMYNDGWSQKLGQAGPVEASYVCLLNRTGLVALDPLSGGVLWSKSGVSQRTRVFGDDQFVYLVEVNADGSSASAARAVRAQDGVTVEMTDFADTFAKRVRVDGRTLLAREELPDGGWQFRLTDIVTGKDLWKQSFPAGSILLKTEEPNLQAVVEPDGSALVFDVLARKELFRANLMKGDRPALNAKSMGEMKDGHLLADRDSFYFILNRPIDVNNGIWPNVYQGLRTITVNGTVCVYERTGQRQWYAEIASQMLLLEQFKSLPVMMFTARYNKWFENGPNRFPQHVAAVKMIHKSSGKLLFDEEQVNQGNQFHAVKADAKAGTIDLVSFNFLVRVALEGENAAPAAVGGGGLAPAPVEVGVQAVPVRIQIAPVQIAPIKCAILD